MGSHNVTCHLAVTNFPPLPQPKLVLDSMTLEGRKAELTRMVVISQWWSYLKIVNPLKIVTYLRNNRAVSWLGIERATASRESDVLSTRPPS